MFNQKNKKIEELENQLSKLKKLNKATQKTLNQVYREKNYYANAVNDYKQLLQDETKRRKYLEKKVKIMQSDLESFEHILKIDFDWTKMDYKITNYDFEFDQEFNYGFPNFAHLTYAIFPTPEYMEAFNERNKKIGGTNNE